MAAARKRILVVDDEKTVRESLQLLLKAHFEVQIAEDGMVALETADGFTPDLVLLDLMMPRMDGIETLKRLRERTPTLPVIMLTAANTVRSAVEAMKCGAVDYLNKPFDVESLTSLIIDTLGSVADAVLPETPAEASRGATAIPAGDFGPLVGKAPPMLDIYQKIRQVAERDTTVLITGESGTGKELVARQIHGLSKRHDKPFIPINCAAIPESLIESELFGHEKGSFTSAFEKRLGYFELANGGTLLLDEIGELSLTVQVKLLRFLQEQEFYRVGCSKPVRVDVRVLTATNKSLEDLITEKKFRQDLYYRINVINLRIPSLRDRFEDIPLLVEHFVQKFSPRYGGRKLEFSPAAMQTLIAYEWPGNARELENVVESLMALAPADFIDDADLPPRVKSHSGSENLKSTQVFTNSGNFEDAARVFETEMILKALRKTNYVQTRAAELLGISRRILKYKMDKLGISEKPEAPLEAPGKEEAL